jgi:hypothetical protein
MSARYNIHNHLADKFAVESRECVSQTTVGRGLIHADDLTNTYLTIEHKETYTALLLENCLFISFVLPCNGTRDLGEFTCFFFIAYMR